MTNLLHRSIPSLVLALGLMIAGWFVGNGFARGRSAEPYVEVKGLAEREVVADIALWPLRFVATGNDLRQTQVEISRSAQEIQKFLARHEIDTSVVQLQGLEVSDAFANRFEAQRTGPRFVIQQTLLVRSPRPEAVLAASQRVSELVGAGVVLSSTGEFGSGGPTFVFTRLNELKPSMIAAATANARAAAEQFATDSRTTLRGIRQASQGVFVILPRDQTSGTMEGSQLNKTVRVVSTVQYFLR
jgi:hypothetical protein